MDSMKLLCLLFACSAANWNESGIKIGLVVLEPHFTDDQDGRRIKIREVIPVNEKEVVIEIQAIALVKHDYYTSITQARSMIEDQLFDMILVYTDGCEEDYIKQTLSNRYIHVYCYTPINTDQLVKVPNSYGGNRGCSDKYYFNTCVFESIMEHFEYRPSILIFDNTTVKTAHDISERMSHSGVQVVELNIDTVDDVIQFVKITYSQLDDTGRNYLVFCSLKCIRYITKLADGFDDMMKNTTAINQLSKWLILDDNYGENYDIYKNLKIDNIATVHLKRDVDLENSTLNLVQGIMKKLKEMIKSHSRNITQSEDLELYSHHQLKQALLKKGNFINAQIHTLLWQPGGREFNLVGEITQDYSITGENKLFPNTDYGLNNKIFRVLVKEWSPFVVKGKMRENKAYYYGLSLDLLEEMSKSMNFSYVLVEPQDGMWGHIANGNWTGIIRDLIEHRADFNVASLALSRERSMVVDFSFPYYHDYSVIVYKLPDPNLNKWKKLSAPFQVEVIICLGISCMVLLLILYYMETSNPFYTIHPGKLPSFSNLFLHLYGALLAQGCPNQPSSSSGRCIVAFWWLFTMIIVAAYCGNLIAFLTVSRDEQPFNTLEEIGQQDVYKWGTVGSTVWETFLLNSNLSEIKTLWAGILEFNHTDPSVLNQDIDHHFKRVDEGRYGFIVDKKVAEIQMKTHCDWVLLKEHFFPMNYAVTLPRNSPYYQLIYKEMMRMYETGMFLLLERKWWNQKNVCGFSQFSELKAIKLIDLQSAFYIMLLGMTVSTVLLVGERISKYSRH